MFSLLLQTLDKQTINWKYTHYLILDQGKFSDIDKFTSQVSDDVYCLMAVCNELDKVGKKASRDKLKISIAVSLSSLFGIQSSSSRLNPKKFQKG